MKPIGNFTVLPTLDPRKLIKTCRHCNKIMQPIGMPKNYGLQGVAWYEVTLDKWDGKGNILWRAGACDCLESQKEKELGYLSAEEKARRGDILNISSGLPQEFVGAKYNKELAAQACMQAIAHLDVTSRYMNNVAKGGRTLLWLHGQSGLGKTHLSCVIANWIMRRHLVETKFISWAEEGERLCDVKFDNTGAIEKLKRAELLVIDDFDKITVSAKSVEVLYKLVNSRWSKRMMTIITTNFSPITWHDLFMSVNKFNEADNKTVRETGKVIIDRLTDVSWNYATLEWTGKSVRGMER